MLSRSWAIVTAIATLLGVASFLTFKPKVDVTPSESRPGQPWSVTFQVKNEGIVAIDDVKAVCRYKDVRTVNPKGSPILFEDVGFTSDQMNVPRLRDADAFTIGCDSPVIRTWDVRSADVEVIVRYRAFFHEWTRCFRFEADPGESWRWPRQRCAEEDEDKVTALFAR